MIKVKNLKFSYGDKDVLKGLNIEWNTGVIHGLIGANGSGKSTLFKIMKGLLKAKVGEMECKGSTLEKTDISFLPTDPVFYPKMKGREYLEFFRIQYKDFDIQKWNEIMQLPLDNLVDNYSTGMKKKLALLGCIGLNKQILLLDEPFNGLDVDAYQVTQEILLHQQELGNTVILSSHISHSLTDISYDISYLENGVIAKTFSKTDFSDIENQLFTEKRSEIRSQLRD